MFWGGGLGSGLVGWQGAVFLWKMRERGKRVGRVGVGVGTGKGIGKSMRARLTKLPFANYLLVSPRLFEMRNRKKSDTKRA